MKKRKKMMTKKRKKTMRKRKKRKTTKRRRAMKKMKSKEDREKIKRIYLLSVCFGWYLMCCVSWSWGRVQGCCRLYSLRISHLLFSYCWLSDNAGWAFANKKEDLPDDEDGDIKKMGDDEPSKTAIILCVVCCCIIILGTVGAVLGAVVFKDDDPKKTAAPSTSPSLAPTPSPTPIPTATASESPTGSAAPTDGLPSEVIVIVAEDTSLRDGNFSSDVFGTEDVLLIKNDPNATFSSKVLLRFDLAEVPFPHSNIFDIPKSAFLQLEHVVGIAEAPGTAVTIVKLPSVPLAVESLSWDIYQPSGGVDWTVFSIESEPEVRVDISEMFFDLQQQQRRRMLRRGLQDSSTLMLMLEARGPDNGVNGIELRSREFENGAKAPKIVVEYPTPAPTIAQTKSPTSSPAPTKSAPPSVSPTSSSVPTASAAPTATASNSPTNGTTPDDGLFVPCIPRSLNATLVPSNSTDGTEELPYCDDEGEDETDDGNDEPDTPTEGTEAPTNTTEAPTNTTRI